MSDNTETRTAAAQNPFLRMADTQLTQLNAFYDEVAKMQTANLEQTKTAMDETARLSKETLGYFAALGAESRRMTLDAYKRSLGLFTPAAV
jgi:hypothetical protein